MFSIDIELLTGRYAAARYDRRDEAEWPPHPARFFSACVATLYENLDLEARGRTALEWLESQEPPWIVADSIRAVGRRSVSNVYVPVNDTRVTGVWEAALEQATVAQAAVASASSDKARAKADRALDKARTKLERTIDRATSDDGKGGKGPIKAAQGLLPERRNRQPRTFPCVIPTEPRLSFVWPESEPPDDVRQSLHDLLSRVVRLGHSTTLVACRLGDGSSVARRPEHVWRPAADGLIPLRVVTTGQLARLDAAFEQHQGVEPRRLPCSFQRYRHSSDELRHPAEVIEPVLDSQWIVFRSVPSSEGRRAPKLRLTRAPDLARAFRGALLKHAEDPPPPVLTGHAPGGGPSQRPHAAYLPLADVGSRWAGGSLLGVALVLPRELDPSERRRVLQAVGAWEQADPEHGRLRLYMGRAGELTLERVIERDQRTTLQSRTWTRPSTRWASVTAIALDRNPGDLRSSDPSKAAAAEREAEQSIATACTRIGLPEPAWVQVMPRSIFDAAPKARDFMPFPKGSGGVRRVCVHAELEFEQPVMGPVLLGAGRYFGLGLCRPSEDSWTTR